MEIPLPWFMAMTLGMNSTGVFWAIVIAESMLGVLGVLVFRRGKWKKQVV
jgi:Na+-driven multidrug efflux pump